MRVSPAPPKAGVSIPFIAGQWSLPRTRPALRSRACCFNPLHCGAVVASRREARGAARRRGVSIPFIAGQWSLRDQDRKVGGSPQVSIPFIAGQWSLPTLVDVAPFTTSLVSIPFIAGQWSLPAAQRGGGGDGGWFQSPSLRGSGRFGSGWRWPGGPEHVSIPFIAGQWSLPAHGKSEMEEIEVSIPFIAGQWSLRPGRAGARRGRCGVSIPFIAGQWSLPRLAAV